MQKTKKNKYANKRDEVIRETARNVGKNMKTVAREMGINQSTLHLNLKHSGTPNNETLARLAKWLAKNGVEINPNELI